MPQLAILVPFVCAWPVVVNAVRHKSQATTCEATESENSTRTSGEFVCPPLCQECCPTGVMGGWFKCVLKPSISPRVQREGGDLYKAQKQQIQDALKKQGFDCNHPVRRSKSAWQWKADCRYPENMDKAAQGKCSLETHCCCSKAEDYKEHRCIDRRGHQWFRYDGSFEAGRNPIASVEEDVIQWKKVFGTNVLVDGQEWRPAELSGSSMSYDRRDHSLNPPVSMQSYDRMEGVCSEAASAALGPDGPKWYAVQTGLERPVLTRQGCCLETAEKLFMSANAENADGWSRDRMPKCTKWEQVPYCDQGQVYVERVGKRQGICFGDQSTGTGLKRVHGSEADLSDEEWDRIAEEGRRKVKGVEDSRGRTHQSCPTGYTHNLGGGLRSCKCSVECGGVDVWPVWNKALW